MVAAVPPCTPNATALRPPCCNTIAALERRPLTPPAGPGAPRRLIGHCFTERRPRGRSDSHHFAKSQRALRACSGLLARANGHPRAHERRSAQGSARLTAFSIASRSRRSFLSSANRTIGQPHKITTIFGRRISKHYRGELQTEIEDMDLPNPVIRSHYGNGFVKQYVRNHLMLRTETADPAAHRRRAPRRSARSSDWDFWKTTPCKGSNLSYFK